MVPAGMGAESVERSRFDQLERLTEQIVRQHAQVTQTLQQYAALAAASPQAIVEVTAEGDIVRWNAAAETLLGWHACEVIGRPVAEVLIPEEHGYRRRHVEALARLRTTGQPRGYMLRKIRVPVLVRGGGTRQVIMLVAPVLVRPAPAVLHFVAFLWDAADDQPAIPIDDVLRQASNGTR